MPLARRSSPPRALEDRLGLDHVVLDPAGHADDLVDPAYAVLVDAEVDDEVDAGAPPSGRRSGPRCSRPRAAAACTSSPAPRARSWRGCVHMPGSPALRASSRSRHSSARTSPTMIRLGRIRRLSLTRSRSRISPVPSSPDCRVCSGTQSGCGKRSSKTSSARDHPLAAGDRRGQAVEHRGLAGLGAAGDQDVEAGADRGLEERRGRAASGCRARPGRGAGPRGARTCGC